MKTVAIMRPGIWDIRFALLLVTLLLAEPFAVAGEKAKGKETGSTGQWTDFTDNLIKPSGTSSFRLALVVDRPTGNVFVSRWNTGVWMSSDQGQTFSRADGGKVSVGGPFTCYSLFAAPEGGKLAAFNMNNKPGPSGYSLDGGKTWESFTSVERNWDYGAIDWDSKAMFAARHENSGMHFSPDLGKTWTQLDIVRKDSRGLGVFGAKELVVGTRTRGIERSEDAGKTWTKVADHTCIGTVEIFKGNGYWLANDKAGASVVISKDKGRTWQTTGKPLANVLFCCGPCFGKDEKHLIVATLKDLRESTNAGATWKTVASYPADIPPQADIKYGVGFPNIGYDPSRDIFYVYFANPKKFTDGRLMKFVRNG